MDDMYTSFPKLAVTRKSGEERFSKGAKQLDLDLRSFWQWSASDLVSNAARGILAEYIVANALGIADGLRTEWDAFDLLTKGGTKIEVKSAAYIQTWYHKNLSKITFSIRPARVWSAETNLISTDLKRNADIYVFCLLAHKEQDSIEPLNLDQWEFYVLASSVLDKACPTQKTIGLASLLRLNPLKAKYDEIADSVKKVMPML